MVGTSRFFAGAQNDSVSGCLPLLIDASRQTALASRMLALRAGRTGRNARRHLYRQEYLYAKGQAGRPHGQLEASVTSQSGRE